MNEWGADHLPGHPPCGGSIEAFLLSNYMSIIAPSTAEVPSRWATKFA